MRKRVGNVLLIAVIVASMTAGLRAQDAAEDDTEPASPALISAFFGLDNALPFGANGLCRGARGQDGMPVIFSLEIDPETLDADDFAVITESGAVNTPSCATLSPAVDTGELRTVLLIGELGDAVDDPPVSVEIIGEIFALDDPEIAFLGASVAVTPLEAGPGLVIAESVPESEWTLDQRSGRQQGNGCLSEGTVQIVRATWAGGITIAGGDEAGEAERDLYVVTLLDEAGDPVEVRPFALADLGDGDNNHLLCLDVPGEPVSVFFPEGHFYDPNADTLNPDTTVQVEVIAATEAED